LRPAEVVRDQAIFFGWGVAVVREERFHRGARGAVARQGGAQIVGRVARRAVRLEERRAV
jgi:hypothetical protein